MVIDQRLRIGLVTHLLFVMLPLLSPKSLAGFTVTSQNPFALIISTPSLHLPSWDKQATFSHDCQLVLSNHWYLSKATDKEKLWIDTESTVINNRLTFYQGQWQFYMQIPMIRFGGGFLDDFIDGYHHFWGMPNGDRHLHKQRQSRIVYQDGQAIRKPDSGFLDPKFGIGFQFLETHNASHAVFGYLKAPVGEKAKLQSSETWSGAVQISHEYQPSKWLFNLQYGFMLQGEHDYFGWQSRSFISTGIFGIAYKMSGDWYAQLQYDYHSPLYENAYTVPAIESHMGTIGIIKKTQRLQIELAVQEDLFVGSTADVSFFVSVKRFYD
ncbi:MAG: DUF3187 family protein [Cellvibrionales bacterium]|nr:DUF3187 family protein [Cellvibrionales bacterium]